MDAAASSVVGGSPLAEGEGEDDFVPEEAASGGLSALLLSKYDDPGAQLRWPDAALQYGAFRMVMFKQPIFIVVVWIGLRRGAPDARTYRGRPRRPCLALLPGRTPPRVLARLPGPVAAPADVRGAATNHLSILSLFEGHAAVVVCRERSELAVDAVRRSALSAVLGKRGVDSPVLHNLDPSGAGSHATSSTRTVTWNESPAAAAAATPAEDRGGGSQEDDLDDEEQQAVAAHLREVLLLSGKDPAEVEAILSRIAQQQAEERRAARQQRSESLPLATGQREERAEATELTEEESRRRQEEDEAAMMLQALVRGRTVRKKIAERYDVNGELITKLERSKAPGSKNEGSWQRGQSARGAQVHSPLE